MIGAARATICTLLYPAFLSPMIARVIHLDLADDYDVRFNKFVSRISRSSRSEMRNDKQQ
jgi:hypothetical protein